MQRIYNARKVLYHCLSQLPERNLTWELVSSPKLQVTGEEEMASSCAKGGLDWIVGKIALPKELSSTGTGCQGISGVTVPGGI